ncbi:NAD(P)/FAD-dependent oxidoreductase [Longitalea luteola]|uniref:NAD(P)/FAD-dependent oxidoreductase n=1 Tax=Longitalea luteola TaxID=2812563 RepID=UPI001A957B1B|nr:FAD-binding oxidoreductase [Longitalea luteola]
MHVDFIIIGQGICGTFLSWELQKAGYSFLVIDNNRPGTASKVAAGIINPVTGRRIVKTWMIDEVMPFAWHQYTEIGSQLQVNAIEQKDIIDFFPTPQMKLAYEKRYAEDTQYISINNDPAAWSNYFNADFGFGTISPCYLVNLHELLPAYRQLLKTGNNLLEENFDLSQLQILADTVHYKGITAQRIIFCDGITSFNNPWFANLPFAPNKGEVLLVEAKDMPTDHIFKKGINWVPWQDNIFWVGSSYEWDFTSDHPTEQFREKTLAILKQWVKAPVRVLEHTAAVRPATIERRPFIGFHPTQPAIGIFNGMGTKGCSLAPFFAPQLVQHLQHQSPLQPEADIQRFKRVLSK